MRLAMILVCALSLASCRRAPAPMPDLFTEVAGAWHRTSVRELPSSLPPDFVPPAAIETHPRGVVRRPRQARRACLSVDLARRGSGRGAALAAGSRHGLLLQRPLLRPHPVADRGPPSASGIRRRARKTVLRQAVIERPLCPPLPPRSLCRL